MVTHISSTTMPSYTLRSVQGLISTAKLSPHADRHIIQRLDYFFSKLESHLNGVEPTPQLLNKVLTKVCDDAKLSRQLIAVANRSLASLQMPIVYQMELRRQNVPIIPIAYYLTAVYGSLLEMIADCVIRKARLRTKSSYIDQITVDDVLYALRDDVTLARLLY